jgi:hypothetical protein
MQADMQGDSAEAAFRQFVEGIFDAGNVIAGAPGSRIEDPAWHYLADPKKTKLTHFNPRYQRGAYMACGQPLATGALEWLHLMETSECAARVQPWDAATVAKKLDAWSLSGLLTTWIGIALPKHSLSL